MTIALLVAITGAVQAPFAADPPSVLVHCARPAPGQWGWWVDLDYLGELRAQGFEVDYTDRHADLTWERVRRYDVLVLYAVPSVHGKYYDNSPDAAPRRDEFIEIVERFLEQGGGVFLMARSLNADASFRPLIERWGARIPYERIVEDDPDKVAPMPRMGGTQRLWFTDDVAHGPVSQGVEQVWLPLTPHYSAAETMPIQVSAEWQVVLRGSSTSRTAAIDPAKEKMAPPDDVVVRKDGVSRPELFAIRSYKAGRIAFCAVWPQYTIGQGTAWLYDRRVLSKGIGNRPSHFGRLIENTLAWLAGSGSPTRSVGGFRTDPQRLVPPNERPGRAEEFIRRTLQAAPDRAAALQSASAGGALWPGLIGAQSALGSGSGTVAEFAKAARRSGLAFVVFLEDAQRLTPQKLDRLRRDCAEQSGPDLQLYPGYRIETNTGNRMFVFGHGARLPPPELLVEGKLNQQYQHPESGRYGTSGFRLIDWLHHGLISGGGTNVGYFGFGDRPQAQQIPDLRLYSMLALRLYSDGALVEDNLQAYLTAAAGTLPPVPAAVHLLGSPGALEQAATRGVGLTYAQAASAEQSWSALAYSNLFTAPNVFTSDGPMIGAWPQARQYYTLGGEPFVNRAAYLAAPIVVRSTRGLRRILIYDGDRLFRRFLIDGDQVFERVLELSAAVQRTLVLVAEDVDGGRAVSTALRCWKGGGFAPVFCGDRINHCDRAPLLAKGPGSFQVSRIPLIDAGFTWDGGPQGEHPILRLDDALRPALTSDKGQEGQRGFNNLPVLAFADEGAVRVRSSLDTIFAEQIPVVNPWATYGPLGGPSRLLRAELTLTAFERPTSGSRPAFYPGFPRQVGAAVSLFEEDVTFKEDQDVVSLRLFAQHPYAGPFPVTLVHGRGAEVLQAYDLSPDKRPGTGPLIATGDWIGWFGAEPSNLSVHVNRGAPLRLRFTQRAELRTEFLAHLDDSSVQRGATLHFELLSVVDPVDAPQRGLERVLEIVRFLRRPGGVDVRRGRRQKGGDAHVTTGLIELEVRDGAASLRVKGRGAPSGVPLPLRVSGLNSRWSVGLLQQRGYVPGNYGPAVDRYRPTGVDRQGRAYVPLFVDRADETRVTIGHPVVSDVEELFIQVTRRHDRNEPDAWHVSVNNPTDRELRATFHSAFDLPGLNLKEQTVTIPAGGYLELR